ncbi:F-box/kelch-repeat protein At3g23880-like [Gastrolobium bilobum]|uniref:F-box/kelch-repeat protein At3g23880-like n=1 Tax=Gastrolobium bilobum TaxID=150636 RepID=UPI002AB296E6|nr:F-box/kelch-repeat protein At3g23880-like [Gastrolobium bilobum]
MLSLSTRSMKNKQMLGLTPTLPHELIEEILLRLPVRSLLLFKCVCKSWLTLISDPQFAKTHFDLAAAPIHCYLVESQHGSLFGSIDIEPSVYEDCALIYFCYSHPSSPSHNNCYSYNNFQILGSCRGFVLLRYVNADYLTVWNPSTGAQKPISCSHYHSLIKILYGLGYDASTDDYLVIIIMVPLGQYSSETHFMFFSMKTNSWNKVEGIDFPYLTGGENYSAGLLLNGALHWLAFSAAADDDDDDTNDDTEVAMIIAFDLTERSLSVIPLPCLTGESFLEIGCHLMVIGGCLSLCYPATKVCWVMKEYKVNSSWTKATYYNDCNYEGGVIIGSDAVGNLMKLNDNRELVVHSKNSFYIESLLQFAMYRESLLSLPSDFGKASEDDEH